MILCICSGFSQKLWLQVIADAGRVSVQQNNPSIPQPINTLKLMNHD